MMTMEELRDWANALVHSHTSVAIDDGGLCLVEIDENGKETGCYLEVGGIPLPEAELSKYERFPKEDWRYEVQNGDTRLGYEDWVEHNVEAKAADAVVMCSLCGHPAPEATAHLHQGKWIGDTCCWTEQLRSSE